jgi:hypothetical protein
MRHLFVWKIQARIDGIHGTISNIDCWRKPSLTVLFAPKTMSLNMLLLTNCALKREAPRVFHSLLGGFEAKVNVIMLRIIAKDITSAIGFVGWTDVLLMATPHLFALLPSGQKDFLTTEQGNAERVRREIDRSGTILTKVRAEELSCTDLSRKRRVPVARDFAGVRGGRIAQLSLAREQRAAAKLNGPRQEDLLQVLTETASPKTHLETDGFRSGTVRL